MLFSIEERIIAEGRYICETGATVRRTAQVFGMSKSCVHKDVSVRLEKLDGDLYRKVKIILERHFAEKHLRGGEATRAKYAGKDK